MCFHALGKHSPDGSQPSIQSKIRELLCCSAFIHGGNCTLPAVIMPTIVVGQLACVDPMVGSSLAAVVIPRNTSQLRLSSSFEMEIDLGKPFCNACLSFLAAVVLMHVTEHSDCQDPSISLSFRVPSRSSVVLSLSSRILTHWLPFCDSSLNSDTRTLVISLGNRLRCCPISLIVARVMELEHVDGTITLA
jgi:hypothetical protein